MDSRFLPPYINDKEDIRKSAHLAHTRKTDQEPVDLTLDQQASFFVRRLISPLSRSPSSRSSSWIRHTSWTSS